MIDLHYLATAINTLIGEDKYSVYVSTNANVDKNDPRTVVTMNVGRRPFAYTTEEIDAESLVITLTFDLPVAQGGADLITKEEALNDIHEHLLGVRTISVAQPTDMTDVYDYYTVTGIFEQLPPSNPYMDYGRKTQQIVVNCTAWVQNDTCKALVGNYVKVLIADSTQSGVLPTELLKINRASTMQVGMDNNLKLSANKKMPEAKATSMTATKQITCLYLGKSIENEFLKIAEGMNYDPDKEYIYVLSYPAFEVQQKVKILSVSTQDSAGVYLQYTLTMQAVTNATIVENSIE